MVNLPLYLIFYYFGLEFIEIVTKAKLFDRPTTFYFMDLFVKQCV